MLNSTLNIYIHPLRNVINFAVLVRIKCATLGFKIKTAFQSGLIFGKISGI